MEKMEIHNNAKKGQQTIMKKTEINTNNKK